MMMRSRGFTLVDLVVVIVCMAIVVTLSSCMLFNPEPRNQAMCRANLRGIGTGIAIYKGEDKNSKFPLLWTSGRPESDIKPTDAAKNLNELKTKLIGREAAMQNMWVIITNGLVPEDAFECPSDRDYVTREFKDMADRRANKVGWRSSAEFSYGLHFPYKSLTTGGDKKVSNPAYLGPHMKGSFVIMADKNPSQNNEPATGVGSDKRPSNHASDGEAYLMFSGAVNFKTSTEDSDVNGDDIYTIQEDENRNPKTPADIDDQYIVRHPALPGPEN